MPLPRRRFLQFAGAATATLAAPRRTWALDYPTKPIRWIIGYPPGGSADTASRILAQWLNERLGQPVIIENKPGAATNISLQAAINAPPDGYTIVYLGTSATVNPSFFESLPFDVLRDIAPVSGFADMPLAFVVNKSIPSRDLADFIAYAKERPGKISMASFGAGTTSHLAGELFQSMTGIKLVHVPYRGEAFALADMISGHVEVMFDTVSAAQVHIRSGALRALGSTGRNRYDELLPGVPAINETVPGYEALSWGGIGAPRGTPEEIINRLNREINAGLRDPVVRKKLIDVAALPIFYSPAEFGTFMAAETKKWAEVIRRAGIKAE
jgi:tripartite-type tricarboxylate transporter receptor subunit TctC